MRRPLIVVFVLVASLLTAPSRAAATHPTGTGDSALKGPVAGVARMSTGGGYWIATADGSVSARGAAAGYGSAAGLPLNAPIVGMAAAPDDKGYWLVAREGGIFAFGSARFLGSRGGQPLNKPIVGMAAAPDGGGYWLVASDGGIFAYGTAWFWGSTGSLSLNQPVVGMAATRDGGGYWLVASDGGIFAFGNAPFHGSAGSIPLARPVVGMAAALDDSGYWLVAEDGGVFAYNVPFYGSMGGKPLSAPIAAVAPSAMAIGYLMVGQNAAAYTFPTAPTLTTSPVVSGLTLPWELQFTPDGTMLFTERPGRLNALVNGERRILATAPDLYAQGETGLMGFALDPGFAANRTLYACQGYQPNNGTPDVRVYKWTVSADYTSATRGDAVVTGMRAASTHTGCRVRIGPDGMLWIGTGDAFSSATSQDLNSLSGKVLRVVPSTGAPAPGNPFGTAVYTYGHRNVQGLAWRPGTSQGFAVEHGPDEDDEITPLVPGGNGGWAPGPGYDQSVPMTDTARFPSAVRPVWASGSPTLATSGATFVTGPQWSWYNGALIVACLKTRQLRAFWMDAAGRIIANDTAFAGPDRLRSPVQGPDGRLYVTTSMGFGNDRILAVEPAA